MDCFSIQILDSNNNTLEVDSCQNPTLVIEQCPTLLPGEFIPIVDGEIVSFLKAGSGISITPNTSGLLISVSGLNLDEYAALSGAVFFGNVSAPYLNVSGEIYTNTLSASVLNFGAINGSGNLNVTGSGSFASGLYVNNIPVSLSGHTHHTNEITDFNSSVSGILSNISLSAGSGLVGGGNLTSNLSFDIGAGDGISVLANNIQVDDTVVRTTGDQYILNSLTIGDDNTYGSFIVRYADIGNLIRFAKINNQPRIDLNGTIYVSTPVGGVDALIISGINNGKTAITQGVWRGDIIQTDKGGTGQSTYSNGQLLIGSGTTLVPNTLTPGQNIIIRNGSGTISISTTGLSQVGHTHTVNNITNFTSGVISSASGVYAPLFSPNFSGIPLAPTAASGTNTNQIANTTFVRTEISNLVNSAPSSLDTLNELAAALGNDSNFATTMINYLANKANLSGAAFSGTISAPNINTTGNLIAHYINVDSEIYTNLSLIHI